MPKSDIYQFWAAFHHAPEGVSVRFPDLPGCFTSGVTTEEAFMAAREALEGFMYVMEQDNDPIPYPSPLEAIIKGLEAGEAACSIQAYMPTIREAMESKAVKKTLTVPKWLNDAAEKQNLNFSKILQEGIKRNLGIEGASTELRRS